MSSLPPPLPPPQPIPKRGLSGCAIAAIVVATLVGLVIVVLGVGGYFFVQKSGGRSGIAKTAIGMANPDYDIIEMNDADKTITVRHKKTGKTATFPMSHMKDGHVDPSDLGLTRDQAEGTGGAPEWVKYPGGRQMTAAQLLGITTLLYSTDDSVEKVIEYYKGVVGDKGVQTVSSEKGTLSVIDEHGSLQIAAQANREKGTLITIVYRGK